MFPRVRAVALATFGFILLAAAPDRLFLFPVESLLTGLGAVYFSIGALSGLSTVRSDRESMKFGRAVGVAFLSIVAVLGWGVFVTGAFGRIDSSSLTWWVTTLGMTPALTAAVVAALLFPLAMAGNDHERGLIVVLSLIPMLAGLVGIAMNPSGGFGTPFLLAVVISPYFLGISGGIPVWYCAIGFSRH